MSELKQLSREIIEEIQDGEIEEKQEVEKRKKELCSELGFSGVPRTRTC